MAGSSSGDRPTASATANSSESIGRAAQQLVGHQHRDHHHQHHAQQQLAEVAHPARKGGLRLARGDAR
jgi:hypothetical protein